jgi:hypothetical protein
MNEKLDLIFCSTQTSRGTECAYKEKIKFAKGGEQNYTMEVFRIIKVIRRTPIPVYELKDFNRKVIRGRYYNKELTPVRITKHATFKIDKILSTRISSAFASTSCAGKAIVLTSIFG